MSPVATNSTSCDLEGGLQNKDLTIFGGTVLGCWGSDCACEYSVPFHVRWQHGNESRETVNSDTINSNHEFHTPNSSVRKNKRSSYTTWIPEVAMRILLVIYIAD